MALTVAPAPLEAPWSHGHRRGDRRTDPPFQVRRVRPGDDTTFVARQNKDLTYEAPFLHLLVGTINLAIAAGSAVLVLLAQQRLHLGATGFCLLITAALGGLTATLPGAAATRNRALFALVAVGFRPAACQDSRKIRWLVFLLTCKSR